MKERRLLYFADNRLNENSRALDDFQEQLPQSQQQRLDRQLEDELDTQESEALTAVKNSALTLRQWFSGNREERADTRWMNAATAVGKNRLAQANERFSTSENRALQRISSRVGKSFRSARLLEFEKQALIDMRNALEKELKLLTAEADQYISVARELGYDDLEDTFTTKDTIEINEKITRINRLLEKQSERLEAGQPEVESLDRVKQADKQLRELAMQAAPEIFVGHLNTWILEAADGKPKNLLQAINRISFNDDTRKGFFFKSGSDSSQRTLMLRLVSEITGGDRRLLQSRAESLRRQAVASYYSDQAAVALDEASSENLQERLRGLARMPVGTTVDIDGEHFGIVKIEAKTGRRRRRANGNYVYLLSQNGDEIAVVNSSSGQITFRAASAENASADEHDTLIVPKLTGELSIKQNRDPSRFEFSTQDTSLAA